MFVPPLPPCVEVVACASADSSAGVAAATSAHTTTLANPHAPDFAWQRGYSWYPDTPGAYPDSKWDFYYSHGGLYDQAHAKAELHTTSLVPDDFAWQRGYSWYPDTPGAYPDSKWDFYYSSGGLYDQSHQLAVLPPNAAGPEGKPAAAPAKKATPATPGHMLLCGPALVLGALEATSKLVQTGKVEEFTGDLKATAKEAAATSSPVGGFIMREHLLQERSVA